MAQTRKKHEQNAVTRETERLKEAFNRDIQAFFARYNVGTLPVFSLKPNDPRATTVHVITGASITPFDPAHFSKHDTHSFLPGPANAEQRYVMNNSTAIMMDLLAKGERVIVHTGKPELLKSAIEGHPNADKAIIFGGDLADPSILKPLYGAIAQAEKQGAISEIRACLYKSFAQGSDKPFKPLHVEPVETVEDAAVKRFRFSYLMMVFAYDLLVNKGQGDLRIVVLSALAAERASYGLLADAADKFANELAWKTFHKEANISTGKPVTIYQVCPGITTACDIYDRDGVKDIVKQESIADGFPFDDDVLNDKAEMPQLSAHDVAAVASALLRAEGQDDPNKDIPPAIRELLWGGYDKDDLIARLKKALRFHQDGFRFGGDRALPDHIYAPDTYYGRLPQKIKKGEYGRISLTPKGQKF